MDLLRQTSLDYISAIEDRLKVYMNLNEEPVFIPARVSEKDVNDLSNDIRDIYSKNVVVDLLNQTAEDGRKKIQGVGFGLVNDFEKFIKIGMLYSNRVILWDYLWGRILSADTEFDKKISSIGLVSKNLVRIKKSVELGGVVMLPHPTSWNEGTRIMLAELSNDKLLYNNTNFGLVSTLSVALDLNIDPYTLLNENTPVYPKQEVFSEIINDEKNEYLYNITEMLDERPFEILDQISANDFYSYLQKEPEFFDDFRDTFMIRTTGKTSAERHKLITKQKKDLIKAIERREKNKAKLNIADGSEIVTQLSVVASIIYSMTTQSTDGFIAATAITSLSSSLAKYLAEKSLKKEKDTLVLGFENLKKLKKPE